MSANANSDAIVQPVDEQELCPQCLAGNVPGTHFCRDCGAALSAYAATGPFECLLAEGNVYRRATERPQRLIVVVGIWLIFGMMAWAGLLTCLLAQRMPVLAKAAGAALVAVAVLIITKTTRNYFRRELRRERA